MMNKPFLYSAALSVSLIGQYGCVPLCSEHGDPSDVRCQEAKSPPVMQVPSPPTPASPAALTIVTRRMALTTSGPFEVTVAITNAAALGSDTKLSLSQDTTTTSAVVGADGKVLLNQPKSGTFHPGAAQLQIVRAAGKEAPVTCYLYVSPDYGPAAVPPFNDMDLDFLWAGTTGAKQVFALTANSLKRTYFTEYHLDDSQTTAGSQSYPHTTSAVIAPLSTEIYLGYVSTLLTPVAVEFWKCPRTLNNCKTIQVAPRQINALAINPQGNLFSAVFGANVWSFSVAGDWPQKPTSMTSVADSRTPSPSLLASGDMNKDGLSDLILWDETSRQLNVLLQKSASAGPQFVPDLALSVQLQERLGSEKIVAMLAADLDQDKLEDLVYATPTQVAWITNLGPDSAGNPKFAAGGSFPIEGAEVSALSVGNADGDARALLDLIVTQRSKHTVRVYPNKATY